MKFRAGIIVLTGLALATTWATAARCAADTSDGSDYRGAYQNEQNNSTEQNQQALEAARGNFIASISGTLASFTFVSNTLFIKLQAGANSPALAGLSGISFQVNNNGGEAETRSAAPAAANDAIYSYLTNPAQLASWHVQTIAAGARATNFVISSAQTDNFTLPGAMHNFSGDSSEQSANAAPWSSGWPTSWQSDFTGQQTAAPTLLLAIGMDNVNASSAVSNVQFTFASALKTQVSMQNAAAPAIPEPAALPMLGLGAAYFLLHRKRRSAA